VAYAGAVDWPGPVARTPAIALVGSADEIAAALIDFKLAGVSQFILSGWPKAESMQFFGEEVLPRRRSPGSTSRGGVVAGSNECMIE
jgi:alkanesulfonate monooxygenase